MDGKIDENANLDYDKHIYLVNGLTLLQKINLANNNYILKKGHGLESGPYSYYVKPNPPESPEHTLLVGLIVDEIQKYTTEVKRIKPNYLISYSRTN